MIHYLVFYRKWLRGRTHPEPVEPPITPEIAGIATTFHKRFCASRSQIEAIFRRLGPVTKIDCTRPQHPEFHMGPDHQLLMVAVVRGDRNLNKYSVPDRVLRAWSQVLRAPLSIETEACDDYPLEL